VCDLETSRIGAPYIYDISNLRVNEVMVLLKVSAPLPTWLAAEIRLAVQEILQVAVNREEFLKLRIKPRLPVISKRDGEHFKPE